MHKSIEAFGYGSFFRQLASYALLGLAVNVAGFVFYLILTWKWLDPKMALSVMYPIGAFIGWIGYSKFVFFYSGSHLFGLLRYVVAYLIGYSVNIGFLYIFVDLLGYSHPLIQAIAIVAVAGILFLLFRYFVFPQNTLA